VFEVHENIVFTKKAKQVSVGRDMDTVASVSPGDFSVATRVKQTSFSDQYSQTTQPHRATYNV